jgi:CDP-diacylglycerol---glycerol-3-phosphate 3-phosphatidyltransferase
LPRPRNELRADGVARYRARDLVRVPGLLSLARIPLGVAFALAPSVPAAFAILIVAGVTDVLDGWVARRYAQVTATGAVLDPITDKLFVAIVAGTLVAHARLSISAVALLATREVLELPLVVWLALSHHARRARTEQAAANAPGKVATALQFACVSAALFGAPSARLWACAAAATGALAALLYWRRALRSQLFALRCRQR